MTYKLKDIQPLYGNAIDLPAGSTINGVAIPTGSTTFAAIHDTQTKTLTNNAANSLFTFPLASGEVESISIIANILAKKGSDWGMQQLQSSFLVYNDGSTLQGITTNPDTYMEDDKNNAGSVTLATGAFAAPSISLGIVTIKYNPGNVGTTPDSIVMNYVVINPSGKVLTFL